MPSTTVFLRSLILLGALGATTALADSASTTAAHDWPRWGGPNMDFTVDGVEIDAGAGLELAWRRPLGSGYAGIVISTEASPPRAITGFSDGSSDFVIALSAVDGKELWRHRLSETYKGHDGSADGVLSTPTLDRDRVYAVGGWGHLVALRLTDGKLLWQRRLDEDFDGPRPFFGFTTAPLAVGDLVVVQAGGPQGQSIVALDRQSGEKRWSTGEDPVTYQSPTLLRLAGEEQVLAVNNRFLIGLEPATGRELWRHEHGKAEQSGSSQPVQIGDGEVLLTYEPEAKLLRIRREGDAHTVEEVWSSRALRGSYFVPVYHQGHLYGYSGQFLSCVDAATGERVWRSRPPGAGGLVLVDGHLLILGRDGDVVMVEATPEGYHEKARIAALDLGSYTAPSFAGRQLYVRDYDAIASVRLSTAAERPRAAASEDTELQGELGRFIAELRQAEDKKARIDAFFDEHPTTPIYEGENLVHLVYRGEVDDLVVQGTATRDRVEPMHRVEGTDFYFRSLELEPGALYAYRFFEFEDGMADPLNPHRAGGEGREVSLIRTPGWTEPEHLARTPEQHGTVETWTWKSERLDNERQLEVYLPAGYAGSERTYPLLLVYEGHRARQAGRLDLALDNLIDSERIQPLVAVMVPRLTWMEHAGSNTHEFSRAVAEELIPRLEERYRLESRAASRAVWGTGAGAFAALFVAAQHPDTFGMVAMQSYYDGDLRQDLETLLEREGEPFEVYAEWSRYDFLDPAYDLDAAAQTRAIVERLRRDGHRVETSEVGDGPGWLSWIAHADGMLTRFFGR